MKYHFIGIKGSGMSALAIILKDLGHEVSGSDYSSYIFTQEDLINKGIEVKAFDVDSLDDVDVVIVGHNFIDSDNVEVKESLKRGLVMVEYHKAVANLLKSYYSIAIAGSAGKTTVTALIASVLKEIDDTSYLIGCGEGRGGNGKYFVFEACEHKEHFLIYTPNIVLVNNVDYDHVDYYKNESSYIKAFYKFINQAQNIVIVNGDDENLAKVNNVTTYGTSDKCMIRAKNISYDNGIRYDLFYKNNYITDINLEMYGEHMVYNTLACISVCLSLGVNMESIKNGLKKFNGVKRRFKETIINGDVYIDDYAHHPSKINAIINAVKQKYKDREIIAFFRPDRVSRLNYFAFDFVSSLKRANEFYVVPFLNNTDEEIDSYNKFIQEYNLEELNENVYSRVSKKKNVIYLMMSSKNMEEVKEKILKYKG